MPRNPTLSPRACTLAGLLLALAWATLGGCTGDTSTALGTTERCDNDADDDGDGLVDCADPDCAGHLACDPHYTELQCDNGMDDDGDGLVDCQDPDCASQQACNPNTELVCNDGVDNDGDGFIDCRDPDCAQAGNCQEHCSDGVDNDGDGLTDCLDPDCATSTVCLVERCANGLDDDGDQLVDCDDPDCAGEPQCATTPPLEHCGNGVDDDGDTKVDCDDPDCDTNPLCVEIFCNDGLDNNGRRGVDCEDSDCQNDPACQLNSTCQGAEPLYCGSAVEGSTIGRVSSFSFEPCLQRTSLAGGERFFSFTNPTNLTMIVSLNIEPQTMGTSFVLLVLYGSLSGCMTTTYCLAPDGKTDLTATVHVTAGQTIFVAVDSVQPGGGEFWLGTACSGPRIELCENGTDDDEDTLIDCWDPDCLGHPACNYWVSAGRGCVPGTTPTPCAPGEECQSIFIANEATDLGICTKPCPNPGMPGPECYNPDFPYGACVSFQMLPSACVMQCGSFYGNPECPIGTVCTNKTNGSITSVVDGVCAPNP